jgi:hypothetical protein
VLFLGISISEDSLLIVTEFMKNESLTKMLQEVKVNITLKKKVIIIK